MHDILPELLKAVKEAYQVNIEQDEEVKRLLNELKSGVADYEKASDYAEHLGDALAKAFQTQITADKLPDGRMYYNIANRLVNTTFQDNYSRIVSYCKGTQESLNKAAGIGLKAQVPEFNQNRADGIIERLSEAENYDDVRWILGEPVTNFAMAIVDDHIKANANFQYKAGLSPKIVRTTNGKCCAWCDRLAGTYNYKDVKNTGNDVFRRHRHCRCKVIYDPAEGKKVKDVWTKKWRDEGEEDKIKDRIEFSEKHNASSKPMKSENAVYDNFFKELNSTGVDYNPVNDSKRELSDQEIVARIAGGDMTRGSCASVGLAYIGQKQGWDVLDFRDGESRKFFSRVKNLKDLSKIKGITSLTADGKSSLTVGNRLLAQAETGKEYYLACGRHASIIRRTKEGKLQYLELQSAKNSGWTDFNRNPRNTLHKRFGCTSKSDYGASAHFDFMVDIEKSDFSTDDFKSLLGFINTPESEQRRGESGSTK